MQLRCYRFGCSVGNITSPAKAKAISVINHPVLSLTILRSSIKKYKNNYRFHGKEIISKFIGLRNSQKDRNVENNKSFIWKYLYDFGKEIPPLSQFADSRLGHSEVWTVNGICISSIVSLVSYWTVGLICYILKFRTVFWTKW